MVLGNPATVKAMFFLVVLSGLGVWLFFDGLKKWRRKRLIEDIPQSKIRSMAMGFVELNGKAECCVGPLKAPFSNTECVFYRYLVERYESSGRSSRWVKVAGDDSICPFGLNDETGKVMVNPVGAEINFSSSNYDFTSGSLFGGGAIPADLINFMEANNIRYRTWFSNSKMRFTEWVIAPGDIIFIVGTALKNESFASDYQADLNKKIEELKHDPEQMKKITDSNGELNISEWDAAVEALKNKVMLEELAKAGSIDHASGLVIQKGDDEKTFIISEKSEKELLSSLMLQSFAETFGGAVLASVCIYLLMSVLL